MNETFVSTFLSGRNPIRKTIEISGCPGRPRTIVGVVANHLDRQRAVLAPMVYVPYPCRAIEPTTLALRTAGDPRPLVPVIRRTYTVTRRTSEIGLRMALGADRLDVIGLIVRESPGWVVAGIVLGLVAALALMRVLESTLFGVSKRDPGTVVAAAILLLVAAAVAAFVPVRRACRIDPMTALRYE